MIVSKDLSLEPKKVNYIKRWLESGIQVSTYSFLFLKHKFTFPFFNVSLLLQNRVRFFACLEKSYNFPAIEKKIFDIFLWQKNVILYFFCDTKMLSKIFYCRKKVVKFL